jgi:hypothetical protein
LNRRILSDSEKEMKIVANDPKQYKLFLFERKSQLTESGGAVLEKLFLQRVSPYLIQLTNKILVTIGREEFDAAAKSSPVERAIREG